MIEWLISEFVEDDGTAVVTEWFNTKSKKNKPFRQLQRRMQTRLDAIRENGPEMVVDDSSISRHIDKIRISGRLTIRVLLMRGPGAHEITLLGASVEKDRELVEPGIQGDVIRRYEDLIQGHGKRQEYPYICP